MEEVEHDTRLVFFITNLIRMQVIGTVEYEEKTNEINNRTNNTRYYFFLVNCGAEIRNHQKKSDRCLTAARAGPDAGWLAAGRKYNRE